MHLTDGARGRWHASGPLGNIYHLVEKSVYQVDVNLNGFCAVSKRVASLAGMSW